MAATTPGHRGANMTIAAQAWQPIAGIGGSAASALAQQSLSCATALHSVKVPSAATGMIVTADVDVSLSLGSTFAATASQGYLLAALTPFPALLLPRQNNWSAAAGSDSTAIKFRAINTKGRIHFMFIGGRGA